MRIVHRSLALGVLVIVHAFQIAHSQVRPVRDLNVDNSTLLSSGVIVGASGIFPMAGGVHPQDRLLEIDLSTGTSRSIDFGPGGDALTVVSPVAFLGRVFYSQRNYHEAGSEHWGVWEYDPSTRQRRQVVDRAATWIAVCDGDLLFADSTGIFRLDPASGQTTLVDGSELVLSYSPPFPSPVGHVVRLLDGLARYDPVHLRLVRLTTDGGMSWLGVGPFGCRLLTRGDGSLSIDCVSFVSGDRRTIELGVVGQLQFPFGRAAGGRLYFVTSVQGHDYLRWADPTSGQSGVVDHLGTEWPQLYWAMEIHGSLYFGSSGGADTSLFIRVDGSTSQAQVVGTFHSPTEAMADPIAIGGIDAAEPKVVFLAEDEIHGFEPWVFNEVSGEVTLLADIMPGSGNSNGVDVLLQAPGQLVLSTDDSVHGREPWITNGTPSGTRLLADTQIGTNSSFPRDVARGSHSIAFSAWTPEAGLCAYATDGTEDGTRLLIEPNAPRAERMVNGLVALGERFMFCAGTPFGWSQNPDQALLRLFVSSGTPESTHRVESAIDPGPMFSFMSTLNKEVFATISNGGVVFIANGSGNGNALWYSDGTSQGTYIIKSFDQGLGVALWPSAPVAWNGRAYFAADDGAHGVQLWSTDGTALGTALVADLNPGPDDAYPFIVAKRPDALYFTASSGVQKLYRLDARTNVLDVAFDPSSVLNGRTVTEGWSVGQFLVFGSDTGTNGSWQLWSLDLDRSVLRLHLVPIPNEGTGAESTPIVIDGRLVYSAAPAGGPTRLYGFNPDSGVCEVLLEAHRYCNWCESPGVFGRSRHVLFLRATDAEHGTELWRSDGTASGTYLLADVVPGPTSSFPTEAAMLGSVLLVSATLPGFGQELVSVPLCPADYDLSGAVSIDDLLAYLTDFEAGSIDADVHGGDPASTTPDGAVTIDDLLYYLDHFENGC